MILNMSPVLNVPEFWVYQDSEVPLVLNMPGIWIYQSSEYARVTLGSEYAWIIPDYVWVCLNMPECAWICLNLPEWLLFYISSFGLQSLFYLNVYRRLEVIVWRNMRASSWRDKTWGMVVLRAVNRDRLI